MSVYIPNMKLPEDCRNCPLEAYYFHTGETRCRCTGNVLAENYEAIPFDGRADWCPLVEVPKHGDLIDRDALMEYSKYKGTHDIVTAWDIANAPTVIPAEEGE